MNREIPKPRPIGTEYEDKPIMREIPIGVVVFQYSASARQRIGSQFWLDPIFWQGPETNAWVGTLDGKLPEGTAVFASRAEARDVYQATMARPAAGGQAR